MLNTSENIFNIPFGGVIIIHYLCITESVITPTGGEPGGGRVDSTALYIFLYKPHPLMRI